MTTARSRRAKARSQSRSRHSASERPGLAHAATTEAEAPPAPPDAHAQSPEIDAPETGATAASNGTHAGAAHATGALPQIARVEPGPFAIGAAGSQQQHRPFFALAKRCVDLVCAATLLVVLSPVIGALAVLIKITSPGPVIFRQQRVGLNEQPFEVLKFRTMVVDAEDRLPELMAMKEANAIEVADAPAFKSPDDPRVTAAGRLMRAYSLDEIPQLWNVCMGSMSLVGPRPLVPAEADALPDWARIRHTAKPGITCTWQISGRSEISFEQRLAMDVAYTRTASLGQDLSILLRTPLAVLSARGAY